MLATVTPDQSRFGSRVRQRRLELGLSQRDAAVAAGISDTTWLTAERGDPVSERTLVGIDRALGWATGSAQTVLDGGEPIPVGPTGGLEERLAAIEAELASLRAQLARRASK